MRATKTETPKPPSKTWITAQQVVETLGISEGLVYKEIREGRLPAIKVGSHYRILLEDFEQYIKKSAVAVQR